MNNTAHTSARTREGRDSAYRQVAAMGGTVYRTAELLLSYLDAVSEKHEAELQTEEILKNEEQLNTWEMDIEDDFIKIIATQRPVATELRFIATSLKTVDHLERIGDYLIHLHDMLKSLKGKINEELLPKYRFMMKQLCSMIGQTVNAYDERDEEAAKQAAELDDAIDKEYRASLQAIYRSLRSPMTREIMGKHLMLLKYLERSADHVTDIDEWIVYAVECIHMELNS